MIEWIAKLCMLCAMSALAQMMLPHEEGRDGIRMVSGILMLRLTFETGGTIIQEIAQCRDLPQLFSCLMK